MHINFGRETLREEISVCKPIFFFSMALPAHSVSWPLILFRNHFSQAVGLPGRVISPSQSRYLHTGQHKHRINEYTHKIYMPWVGFEPTIPESERAKTVHALDCAATVTGFCKPIHRIIFSKQHNKKVVSILSGDCYVSVINNTICVRSSC
jgi:hypothetical protein